MAFKNSSIVALHNTDSRRLRFASKIGGMPCASIAYTNTDHLYEAFGDISLLCSPDMANPAQSSLYACDSDIYTSRFPSVQYSVDREELKDLIGRAIEISDMFSSKASLLTRLTDDLESDSIESLIHKIHRFPELFLQFEEEVLGKPFSVNEWAEKKITYRTGISSRPSIQKWVANHFESNDSSFINRNDPDIARLEAIIKHEIDAMAKEAGDAFDKTETPNYRKNKGAEFFKQAFEKEYFANDISSDVSVKMSVLRDLELDYEVWSASSQPLDIAPLTDYARAQNDSTKTQFEQWLSETLSPAIQDAYFFHQTPSGTNKRKKLTLDNLTSSMKRTVRGGENFNYGAGSVRAQVAKNFRSWRAIEKNAHRMIGEAEFEKTKEHFNERFSDLLDELTPFYKFSGGNPFMQRDDISNIVSEYAAGRHSSLTEGFNLNEDFPKNKIDAFIQALKNAPTQYFEGKFKRAVDLSEFSAAVIPKYIAESDQQVLSILKENGIPFEVYDPAIEQDRENKVKIAGDKFKLSRTFGLSESEFSMN